MKSILLLVLFSSNLYAMCEFAHNPAIYCLKAKLLKKERAPKGYCKWSIKSLELIRPAGTYSYSKRLERVNHMKKKKLLSPILEKIHFKDKECKKFEKSQHISQMIRVTCSDRYPKLKDGDLLALSRLEGDEYDPWSEKKISISCK